MLFNNYKALFLVEQGETGAPLDRCLDNVRNLGIFPLTGSYYIRDTWAIEGHARVAQIEAAKDDAERARRIKQLARAVFLAGLGAWIPLLKAHHRIIKGYLQLYRGKPDAALALSVEAEVHARKGGVAPALFEAARLRARILKTRGVVTSLLEVEAKDAVRIAREHGWAPRAEAVVKEFDLADDVATSSSSSSSSTSGSSSSATSGLGYDPRTMLLRRRLDALLEVSTASASVFDPERLARVCLDKIVQLLGAERALLFLPGDNGDLKLAAARSAAG